MKKLNFLFITNVYAILHRPSDGVLMLVFNAVPYGRCLCDGISHRECVLVGYKQGEES